MHSRHLAESNFQTLLDTADAISSTIRLMPNKPYLLARTSFIPATSSSQSIP